MKSARRKAVAAGFLSVLALDQARAVMPVKSIETPGPVLPATEIRIHPFAIFEGKSPFQVVGPDGRDISQNRGENPRPALPRRPPLLRVEIPKSALPYIRNRKGFLRITESINADPTRVSLRENEKAELKKYIDFEAITRALRANPKFALLTTSNSGRRPFEARSDEPPIVLAQAPAAILPALVELVLMAGSLIGTFIIQQSTEPLTESGKAEVNKQFGLGITRAVDASICSEDQKRPIQNRVNSTCKGEKRSCLNNDPHPVLLEKLRFNYKCLAARQDMQRKCYPGGRTDRKHAGEINGAIHAIKNCEELINKSMRPARPYITVPTIRIPPIY